MKCSRVLDAVGSGLMVWLGRRVRTPVVVAVPVGNGVAKVVVKGHAESVYELMAAAGMAVAELDADMGVLVVLGVLRETLKRSQARGGPKQWAVVLDGCVVESNEVPGRNARVVM